MNSPIYILNVAAWFKSTFIQDGNGKIILSHPEYESPGTIHYGIPDIIKNINNNDYYAILDHIEKACKQGNWVYSGPNVPNELFYLRINYESAKAELYMNSIYDTTELEEFLKPVTSTAKMFSLSIPKSEFIKYLPENNWYYKFNKYGDQKMYLAWENECLRKRVEDLEVNLRNIIQKIDKQN